MFGENSADASGGNYGLQAYTGMGVEPWEFGVRTVKGVSPSFRPIHNLGQAIVHAYNNRANQLDANFIHIVAHDSDNVSTRDI